MTRAMRIRRFVGEDTDGTAAALIGRLDRTFSIAFVCSRREVRVRVLPVCS